VKLREDLCFLKVEKEGFVDSSSIVAIRDSRGLICIEIGGGGEKNIRQTKELFQAEGLSVYDIHTVIISHTHADHMGAIAHFRALNPEMIVVDHETDAPFLQDNRLLNEIFNVDLIPRYFPGERMDMLEFYEAFCPISETRPDQTVVEGDTLRCGPYSFQVIHTPGHHPGHISLFEPEQRVLFVGDMLGLEVPFYTPNAGGSAGFMESMRKFRALEPDLIIPSHGALIHDAPAAVRTAAGKVMRREERLLEALSGGPRIFQDLLPALFRNAGQYVFPGAAILASHLQKLYGEGRLYEEEGRYHLAGV
jgi:glyoxylase-like metal-dependent hydrolase (beta-lactamase superfamily II)